jgi:hypothetical protein
LTVIWGARRGFAEVVGGRVEGSAQVAENTRAFLSRAFIEFCGPQSGGHRLSNCGRWLIGLLRPRRQARKADCQSAAG